MRNPSSSTWSEIITSGAFNFETKLIINDKEYLLTTAPKIERTMTSGYLKLGETLSSTLEVSLITTDDIPRGAELKVLGRVVNGSTSDWETFGTYYIDSRTIDYETHLISLKCYDAMQRANIMLNYSNEEALQFPKQMSEVVIDIANRMGVSIDERTTILTGSDYYIGEPVGMTMADVLGLIGFCNGGNFVITENNELRLIPILERIENPVANADAVIGSYTYGTPLTISGVKITLDSEHSIIGGTDDGSLIMYDLTNNINLLGENAPQSIAYSLAQRFAGITYYPFSSQGTVINPLVELGDIVTIGNITSRIYNASLNLSIAYRTDLKAQDSNDIESEYPYYSSIEKLNIRLKTALAEETADRLITEAELKDNVSRLLKIETDINAVSFNFNTIKNGVEGLENFQQETQSYIRFINGGIVLGKADSDIKLRIENDIQYFYTGSDEGTTRENAIAYFSDGQLVVKNVNAQNTLTLGDFYWFPEPNGSLSLIYNGE